MKVNTSAASFKKDILDISLWLSKLRIISKVREKKRSKNFIHTCKRALLFMRFLLYNEWYWIWHYTVKIIHNLKLSLKTNEAIVFFSFISFRLILLFCYAEIWTYKCHIMRQLQNSQIVLFVDPWKVVNWVNL